MTNEQISEITTMPTNSAIIKIINALIKRYNSLGSIYTFKGNVQTYNDLLAIQNPNVGDVYNVIEEDAEHQVAAGSNFVWDGTVWDNLGGSLAGLVQSVNGINPDSLGNVLLPLIKNITTNQGVITFTKNDDTTIRVDNIKKLYTVGLGQTVDLNNLVEAGIYMCGNDSYAANYENCPVQKSFLLEVQQANDESMVYQFLTQYNDGSTGAGNQYVRTYQVTNGWSAWRMAGSGSNLTTYTSLEQIGITPGEETLESIHNALSLNSEIVYYRTVSAVYNHDIYPAESNYGYFKATKLWNNVTKFEYLQYTTATNIGDDVSEHPNINLGVLWSTYLDTTTDAKPVWNMHINAQRVESQTIHSTFTQSIIDDSQNGVGIADFAGYSKDGLRRIGGFQVAKMSVNDELRSRNVLYVCDNEGTYHSTLYSDWSPSMAKVLTTLQGLVRVTDHIQFIGKDNGQFGYKEVASSADVTAIPQGSYFFYGNAPTGDSDDTLAGTDFQGISMRQGGQAMQIVCIGGGIYWRYDDSSDAGSNPSYSAWYKLAANSDAGWTISKGTNGWARESSTGLTLQWGVVSKNAGLQTITFPKSFTTVYTVVSDVAGDISHNENPYILNITKTSFQEWHRYGNHPITYIAIGIS